MSQGLLGNLRSGLVRGFLIVLPLLLTIWVLKILVGIVDTNVSPWIQRGLAVVLTPEIQPEFTRFGAPLLGLIATLTTLYLIGVFAGSFIGRRVVRTIEDGLLLRIPLVKAIYGPARQLLDALARSGKGVFSKVVLVEYPRSGIWTVGLVAGEQPHRLGPVLGTPTRGAVPVFFATTPNPTSGWLAFVPIEQILVLDMSVEDGVKLIVSGGIVCPKDLAALIQPWEERSRESAEIVAH